MITGTKTAIVLAIGVVKPHTGETGYGWSMYDSVAGHTGVVTLCDGFLVYHSNADDFVDGETIVLKGNDSGRKLKTARVVASCPAERDAVLKMLLDNGYDYYPARAFRKKRFSRKLSTSYSLKGITIE